MVDETLSGGGSTASICPWCSASYEGDPERCPSCDATLSGDAAADPALPGLTAIDAAALVRSKEPVKKSRNRLLSWISGEYPDQGLDKVEAGALAPPDPAVRREILRLEIQAEVASLQAEADAMRADIIVEGHAPGADPADAAAAAEVAEQLEAMSAEMDATAAELKAVPADEAEAAEPGEEPAAETALDDAAATATDRPV